MTRITGDDFMLVGLHKMAAERGDGLIPEMLDVLRRSREALSQREERIIRLRFGIGDGCPRTLEEVGSIFNITRERVRQIEAKALKKLRHPSKCRELLKFYDL